MNNKIIVDKKAIVLGLDFKTSSKGNKYGSLTIADSEGNIHKVYVPSNLVETVSILEQRQDIQVKLEVVYRGKFPKVEMLNIEL